MAKRVKRNPRIPVVFTPEGHDLVRRLAALQSTSMSKVVQQLFESVEPTLRDLVAALEAAKDAKGRPVAQLLAAMGKLQASVQDTVNKAVDQGDMFSGKLAREVKKLRRRTEKPGGKRKRAKAG